MMPIDITGTRRGTEGHNVKMRAFRWAAESHEDEIRWVIEGSRVVADRVDCTPCETLEKKLLELEREEQARTKDTVLRQAQQAKLAEEWESIGMMFYLELGDEAEAEDEGADVDMNTELFIDFDGNFDSQEESSISDSNSDMDSDADTADMKLGAECEAKDEDERKILDTGRVDDADEDVESQDESLRSISGSTLNSDEDSDKESDEVSDKNSDEYEVELKMPALKITPPAPNNEWVLLRDWERPLVPRQSHHGLLMVPGANDFRRHAKQYAL